ncbi:uncharacterized protein B0I36DRAFT_366979 [Microdochium trichocladiopsis]|uniref:Uncharacterized protein n=1 Tax=Microdochium trichocladiopsis TaxID=1682393 RepID=A0A9P8XYX3_9PEZI|nr:uncharacterized protein B0I36DRAFT_366979 [Microdochium trichocladiopsis]KAH7025084.1 hypothetical protein B0I36DRAFT_366979 [Microdochium trichocladiopsis]
MLSTKAFIVLALTLAAAPFTFAAPAVVLSGSNTDLGARDRVDSDGYGIHSRDEVVSDQGYGIHSAEDVVQRRGFGIHSAGAAVFGQGYGMVSVDDKRSSR